MIAKQNSDFKNFKIDIRSGKVTPASAADTGLKWSGAGAIIFFIEKTAYFNVTYH
jgi:hypothetical protein